MRLRTNWFDRAVAYVSPQAGLQRAKARTAFDVLTNKRDYEGASRGRRTDGWRTAGTSADAEISRAGPLLRDRMRDLVRNNPHAAKAVSVLATNMVGDGILPRANTGDAAVDKKINGLFDRWYAECDADGQLDFAGLQTLMVRGWLEGGETFLRQRRRRLSDGLASPVQVQVLEADMLNNTQDTLLATKGSTVIQGIEFDRLGRRTAYLFYAEHPGNDRAFTGQIDKTYRVPAGEVAHLYEKQRTQVRGVPWGAPVVTALRDLGDYEDAEIMRKKLEACMVGVVTGGDEADMASFLPPQQVDEQGNPINDPTGVYDSNSLVERMEPGMFLHARGGRNITFNDPKQNGGYAEYKRASVRTIAAGFRVPYELLSGDLSEVNYSSMRGSIIEFRRVISAAQWQIIIPMACQKMWDWFIEGLYLAGEIRLAKVPVKWSPPRFMSVDPLKDAMADLLDMRSGTKTFVECVTERGRTVEEVLSEHKQAAAQFDTLGLIFDSDPRKVTKAGILQDIAAMSNSLDDKPPKR